MLRAPIDLRLPMQRNIGLQFINLFCPVSGSYSFEFSYARNVGFQFRNVFALFRAPIHLRSPTQTNIGFQSRKLFCLVSGSYPFAFTYAKNVWVPVIWTRLSVFAYMGILSYKSRGIALLLSGCPNSNVRQRVMLGKSSYFRPQRRAKYYSTSVKHERA